MNDRYMENRSVRQENQYRILRLLRRCSGATRADLAQQLGLSPPSISDNVGKLLEQGLVIQGKGRPAGGERLGRKGIPLELNPDYTRLIGVGLSSARLQLGISSLREELLEYRELSSIDGMDGSAIQEQVKQGIGRLLEDLALEPGKVGALVVCAPGIIQESTGAMSCAPQFRNWNGLNLKRDLEEFFHIPTVVKNDCNLMAMAEAEYGWGREYPDFVLFHVDLGVGAGMIRNGALYEGARGAAGEAGYLLSAIEELTAARQRGALEEKIALPRIRERLAEALGRPLEEMDVEEINRLYSLGDPAVHREADKIARRMAMAIWNMNALLDVPLVCLGGGITRLELELRERIKSCLAPIMPSPVEVQYSSLGHRGFLRGAFALGVETVFSRYVSRYYHQVT